MLILKINLLLPIINAHVSYLYDFSVFKCAYKYIAKANFFIHWQTVYKVLNETTRFTFTIHISKMLAKLQNKKLQNFLELQNNVIIISLVHSGVGKMSNSYFCIEDTLISWVY